MVAGMAIMVIGVSIAKSAGYFETIIIHYILDMPRYAIHGLRCIPYIEYLLEE
jgi:hypothetical protein